MGGGKPAWSYAEAGVAKKLDHEYRVCAVAQGRYDITPVERAERGWHQCILSPRAGFEWLRPA